MLVKCDTPCACRLVSGLQGILSHLLTRGVVRIFRWDVQDIFDVGSSALAPSAVDAEVKGKLRDADRVLRQAESKAESRLRKAKKEAEAVVAKAKSEASGLLRQAKSEAEGLLSQTRGEAEGLLSRARKEGRKARAEGEGEVATAAEVVIGPQRPEDDGELVQQ